MEAAFDSFQLLPVPVEALVDVGHAALQVGELVLPIGQVPLDRRHAPAEIAEHGIDLVNRRADRSKLHEHQVLDLGVHTVNRPAGAADVEFRRTASANRVEANRAIA
ncbi:MAG: hypothetical protein OXI22_03100 [Defluviicoccus sp.]|nr:hypothetical protein [Defluviicoccus sp.]MDE0382847.1 hypothetical protein [Defluviicoccus sp.]